MSEAMEKAREIIRRVPLSIEDWQELKALMVANQPDDPSEFYPLGMMAEAFIAAAPGDVATQILSEAKNGRITADAS
jgi:hypothetical protein